MSCLRGSWVFAAIALPCLLLADPPHEPKSQPVVGHLISQLGNERFAARSEAMEGLEKLGTAVLPQLHDAMNQPADPEVRRRLEEVITKLETMGALRASLVTLHADEQPIRKVVEEIGRQAGYKLEIHPPANNNEEKDPKLISVDLQEVTFWEALRQVCELGGLVLQENWHSNDPNTVRLAVAESFPGYVCLEGPFRVVARAMNYSRTLDLGGQRNTTPQQRQAETLNLTLSITVEPRLPLYGVGQPNLEEALDDLGRSLKPAPMHGVNVRQAYYSGYRGFTQQVNLTLSPVANGQRIKSLRGTIPVTLIALQRPKITVEKLSESAKKSFKAGTTTLAIEEVNTNGNQVTLKFSLSESNRGGVQDYSWVNTVVQRLEVQDENGAKMQSFNTSWGMNGNTVQGTFTYGGNNAAGTPTRLIYYDWVTLSHDVPFEFRDLPLP